ncbi:MAG: histidine phosphatase family protein [Bauldia sp.]|nr:histidine phosphatase family protein [Bauldia sp.]
MSRLLLLRHAKSDWGTSTLTDFDRPLAPRGKRAAADVAKAIADDGMLPDRILCSPARRTRETLAALEPYLDDGDRVEFVDSLYESTPGEYLRVIAAKGDAAGTLMVIGHNPATHGAALALSGTGEPGLLSEIATKYPTGALAVIDFEGTGWAAISPGEGHLKAFVQPRELER